MKTALQFFWASLAATLAAMALLTLTMPLYLLATTGSVTDEGLLPTLGSLAVMLPFVIVIGGTVALPVSMAAGGAMLWWERKRGGAFTSQGWIIAGLVAGGVVSAFTGTNDPDFARMMMVPWFASAGAMGVWVFVRIWRRRGRQLEKA